MTRMMQIPQYNNEQATADHRNSLPTVSYSLNEAYAKPADTTTEYLVRC
jgi:hypothetical protein